MTLEKLNLQTKWQISREKLKKKLKLVGKHMPTEGLGLHVDIKEVEVEFKKHTSVDGAPPLKGAKDD